LSLKTCTKHDYVNPKMVDLKFDEATHTYRLHGRIVPSVTQVISETIGTGWKATEWYLQRGKAIHACAEFIAKGKDFKSDERISGEVAAIKTFFAEVQPEVFEIEKRVGSYVFQYAGTIDLICKINGRWAILDWKHSFNKIRIGLQLGGYSNAHEKLINCGYGVQLSETGKYQMTEAIDLSIERRKFLALRTAYRIKEQCGELSSQKEKANG